LFDKIKLISFRIRKTLLNFKIQFAVLLFLSLLFYPSGIIAQDDDRTLVVDEAGIFGNSLGDVEQAAKDLAGKGADVRVRTINTFSPEANLDRYEALVEQQSPSWLAPEGGLKNNMIIVLIALQERQVGLYYGDYWTDIIGNQWMPIQQDVMAPLFAQGNYAAGTIRGLNEIQNLISEGPPSPSDTTPTAQTSPPGVASGGGGGWIIAVIVVVFVGAIVALILFLIHRQNRARRIAASQQAVLAKQAAASGINQLLEAVQMLEIKVDVTSGKAADAASDLKNGLEKAKKLLDISAQRYSELSHSAGDPENPRLAETQLKLVGEEYRKILDNLREVREAVNIVEADVATVQQSIENFPPRVAEANSLSEQASNQIEELKQQGFNTIHPHNLLTGGRDTLKRSQDAYSARNIKTAFESLALASDQIKQALQAAQQLPQKKQEALTAIPLLSARIEQIKTNVNQGRDVFERLSRDYADSNWESIRGNGTEAENRVNWALETLADAEEAASDSVQDWYSSLDFVQMGNTWLNEAETLVGSISELESNLKTFRRELPAEIEAANTDIKAAWDYIYRYDEDIRESLEDDLREAEKQNELAREELKQSKPDYFKSSRLTRQANASADKILVQAREEHENAKRLRAKAESAKRDALSKVAIASKYIQNHHPVVQHEARNSLTQAVEMLRRAEAEPEPEKKITLAEQAEARADQAYSQAHRDVDETNRNITSIMIPPVILVPPVGRSSGQSGWGSSRPGRTVQTPPSRPRGGGSSGWSSRSGGSGRRGGGSSGC